MCRRYLARRNCQRSREGRSAKKRFTGGASWICPRALQDRSCPLPSRALIWKYALISAGGWVRDEGEGGQVNSSGSYRSHYHHAKISLLIFTARLDIRDRRIEDTGPANNRTYLVVSRLSSSMCEIYYFSGFFFLFLSFFPPLSKALPTSASASLPARPPLRRFRRTHTHSFQSLTNAEDSFMRLAPPAPDSSRFISACGCARRCDEACDPEYVWLALNPLVAVAFMPLAR